MPNIYNQDFSSYIGIADRVVADLNRLPPFIRYRIENQATPFLELIKTRRSPRILIMGNEGAGKTTLISALLSSKPDKSKDQKIHWINYRKNEISLSVLEITPSLIKYEDEANRDSNSISIKIAGTSSPNSKPVTPIGPDSGLAKEIVEALEEQCPDLIIYMARATEDSAAWRSDLGELEKIYRAIKKATQRELPVIGVLTHCDSLNPLEIWKLPTDNEEKNNNIKQAQVAMERQLRSKEIWKNAFVEVVPIVGFVRFKHNGTPDTDHETRWNIDYLSSLLIDELPNETKFEFARILQVKKMSRSLANKVVELSANTCGMFATEPLPVMDLPLLSTVQTTMIIAVAYISGRDLSFKVAAEFLGAVGSNVGSGLVKMEAQRALKKLLPGFGNVASGQMSASFTRMVGEAAIAYFVDQRPLKEVKQLIQLPR